MTKSYHVSFFKNALLKILWLVFPLFFLDVLSADCKEPIYYSIHLSSFKHLINANKQVNTLKVKGKIVFWKKTDVPGKGIFFRVYIGKYKDYNKAFSVWKGLDEAGIVNYLGIHINHNPPSKTFLIVFAIS